MLTYDILRLSSEDSASAEFNTVACFDIIITALVLVACLRLGIGRKFVEMLFYSLAGIQHYLRTSHGTSETYTSTPAHKYFGTGKCSGGSLTA